MSVIVVGGRGGGGVVSLEVGGGSDAVLVLRCGWRAGGGVVHGLLLASVRNLRLQGRRSVGGDGVAGRVGVWERRRVYAHSFHELLQPGLLTVCTAAFGGFDGVQELAAFAAAVFDKRLDVLFKAFHSLLHLGVELSCPLKARVEVDVRLVHLAVPAKYCVPLSRERLVFVLLRTNALVLQKVAVSPGQLLHDGRLLVHGL